MNFLEGLIFPPGPDHLILAKLFLFLISVVFIAYFSFLFGGAYLSLSFNRRGRSKEKPMYFRFSKEVLDKLAGNFWVALLLAVLPALILTISYGELLFESKIKIIQYFGYFSVTLIIGLVLIYWYKGGLSGDKPASGPRVFAGALGILSLLLSGYIFVMSNTLVMDPEKWGFINTVFPFFFISAGSFARFLLFFAIVFGFTGLGILFFLGGKKDTGDDEEYRRFVRKFGTVLALANTIIQPIFFLWSVVNLSFLARSTMVYFLALVVIILLFIEALRLYNMLIKPARNGVLLVFGLGLLILFGYKGFDHSSRQAALRETELVLLKKAEAAAAQKEAQKAQFMPKKQEVNLALGENIFKTKCSACHRFDVRVVGPAYKDVLPRYKGNLDALIQFVLKPVKIDPGYPPMPNQALTPDEASAVAKYILNRYETEFEGK